MKRWYTPRPATGRSAAPNARGGDFELTIQEAVLELPAGTRAVSLRTALKALRTTDPEGRRVAPLARELLLADSSPEILDTPVDPGSVVRGNAKAKLLRSGNTVQFDVSIAFAIQKEASTL